MFGECTEGTTVTSTISQKVSRGEFDSSFLKKTTQIGVVERMLSSRFLTFVARPCIKLNKDTERKLMLEFRLKWTSKREAVEVGLRTVPIGCMCECLLPSDEVCPCWRRHATGADCEVSF